ncbi:hypothetical protein C8R44DRAFT_631575 [Mycena epipterygia]|nr:hypothetical protein C8R44DRAFT_631575 [Mycena epipterygia]
MAFAWPRIESLLLSSGRSHRITSRVTLEGIYAFAKHCPRLHLLCMTFDATVVPKIKINAQKRVSQSSLDRLGVEYSHISKPRPVAKFLTTIFPHLDIIDTLYEELPNYMADVQVVASHQVWKKAETALESSGAVEPNSHIGSVRKSTFSQPH